MPHAQDPSSEAGEPRMTESLRVLVCGMVGMYPVGGVAFDYLQYVVGLEQLGHEVLYHENTWTWPYDPVRRTRTDDPAYSAQFLGDFFARYVHRPSTRWHYQHLRDNHLGMGEDEFRRWIRGANVVLNISGATPLPEGLPPSCRTIFVDTDPGYNQILLSEYQPWAQNLDGWREVVDSHTHHATYAENLPRGTSLVPDLGLSWLPTRMPVVLDLWQRLAVGRSKTWTTIMTWNAFPGPLRYRGHEYGSKDIEFQRIIDVPRDVDLPLEVAVGGTTAPVRELQQHGWRVVDAPTVTRTAGDYVDYLCRSRGEFSVAKNVYVEMKTGWFSCRSACYLAGGRPAVVQDTGFAEILDVDAGLLSFSDAEEAMAALELVEHDYDAHCLAAREVGREYFGADYVLQHLLDAL